MLGDIAHGNPSIHEEPREPSRKGDLSETMGHTHLPGRARRDKPLVASRRRKWTSRIRTSGVPGGLRIVHVGTNNADRECTTAI